MLTVNLKRENSQYPLTIKMCRYSKIKDASWWIIVGNPHTNELICFKKISFNKTLKREIQINLPLSFKESPSIQIHFISDSYIGINQVITWRFKQSK